MKSKQDFRERCYWRRWHVHNSRHEKAHCRTTDDPNADPDTPASDGEGSRGNFTVIGQAGYTYDNNRNMLADGTREFRYNYKNQLRKVWRKSDGGTGGRLADYREDAFGRRVLAQTWWELSRHVRLDTRFKLDINLDANSSSTEMELIDGGITSNSANEQTAEWKSYINRTQDPSLGAAYFDFLLHVPSTSDPDEYLGKVGISNAEVHIFGGYYKRYNASTSQYVGSQYNAPGGSTAGWRNIGLAGGGYDGVFIDGVSTGFAGVPYQNNPTIRFGTKATASDDEGIKLFENLNYIRSYNRTQYKPDAEIYGGLASGVPHVSVTLFDGIEDTSISEVDPTGQVLLWRDHEDGSESGSEMVGILIDGELHEILAYLPDLRGRVSLVVSADADAMVMENGVLTADDVETVGVSEMRRYDAAGAVSVYSRQGPTETQSPDVYGIGDPLTAAPADGLYELAGTRTVAASACVTYDSATGLERSATTTGYEDRKTSSSWNKEEEKDPPQEEITDPDPTTPPPPPARGKGRLTKEGRAYYKAILDYISTVQHRDRDKLRKYIQDLNNVLGYDLNWDDWQWLWSILNAILNKLDPYEPVQPDNFFEVLERQRNPDRVTSSGIQEAIIQEAIIEAMEAESEGESRSSWSVISSWVGSRVQGRLIGMVPVYGQYRMIKGFVEEAQHYANKKTYWGDEVGLLGGVVGALNNQAFGTGDIGDGLEKAAGGEDWATRLEGALQASDGFERYAAAVAGVAAGALARGNCFVAGTLVVALACGADPVDANAALARGLCTQGLCVAVPIERLSVGDWVLSRMDDRPDAPLVFRQVRRIFATEVNALVDVTVVDWRGESGGTIRTTLGHPFWVSSTHGSPAALADPALPHRGSRKSYRVDADRNVVHADSGWVFATDLKPGYAVASASGSGSEVVHVRRIECRPTKVYNFEVGETHTYFVAPTTDVGAAVWVHNTSAPKRPGGTTTEVKTRSTPGRDGATSRHIIEKSNGDTISVTHQVVKDGKVIHQHQTHVGREGTHRQFPNSWVEYPTIGE